MTRVDRRTFEEYVHEALSHLYDHLYLETHPLAALLAAGPRERARGRTLHRLLMEAVDALNPPDRTPYRSLAWRKYRHLTLRYVEEMTPRQIAEELGVSARQCRRDHHEAILAVASRLWDLYCDLQGSRSPVGRESGSAAAGGPPGLDSLVDGELSRLGSVPPSGPVSVYDVVEGALTTLATLARDRNVVLQNAVPSHGPSLTISRAVLRQIILGMLLYGLDQAARRIEIGVSNAGRAVEFWMLATSSSTEGTHPPGFTPSPEDDRLLTIRRLAEMVGGAVRLTGSAKTRLLLKVQFPSASPPTVVVIEDNPDMASLLRRYLVAGGYRVAEAATAAAAVECIRQEHPVAVTLDVMMPTQDGWEVLQLLKIHPETRSVPVIVCSVLRERELALSLGAADLLPKPVTQTELLEALARCQVEGHSAARRGCS